MIPVEDPQRSWLATEPEVVDAATRVIRAGRFVHGPEHAQFEQELAQFAGVEFAVGVGSGSDAVTVGLRALGCGPGSEVITVANAGGYGASSCAQISCNVVYADVDPRSLTMSSDTLARVLRAETSVVIVTHLYGNIVDVATIRRLCDPHGVRILEDWGQAPCAADGQAGPTVLGDVATLSFYPNKLLCAAGDGGAALTRNPELAARLTALREHGRTEGYQVTIPGGQNSRLDEIQAAILRIGLARLPVLAQRQQQIAARYRQACAQSGLTFVTGAHRPSVAFRAVVRAGSTDERDALRASLASAGVATAVHYPVLDVDQPGFPAPSRESDLAESRRAVGEVVTVPCFPSLSDAEVSLVCAALYQFGQTVS